MKQVETVVLPDDIKNAGFITHELKPCPFCGCNYILTAGTKNERTNNVVYRAFCTNNDCMASVHLCLGGIDMIEDSRRGVVEKWNKRV
jgi:Lar family restriction alleviation protein